MNRPIPTTSNRGVNELLRTVRRGPGAAQERLGPRGGRSTKLGVEFDVYWLSPAEMEGRLADAGFATVFWGGRPAEGQEGSAQGYLLAQKSASGSDFALN